MTTLMKEWARFVANQAVIEPYIIAGSQMIYSNLEWTIPAELLLKDKLMKVENIGFTPTKISHLTRHYENPLTIKRAKHDLDQRLANRKYGSGVWDFRGETKTTTKQDFCLTAGVIAYYPTKAHTRLFIHYRTVELVFRYRADLIFLRDIIFPQFKLERMPPDTLTFRFVNATIHPMFHIMLLIELDDFDRHMLRLKRLNPKGYHEISRWTLIHLEGKYKKYATAKRVQNFVDKPFNAKKVKAIREFFNDIS